MVSPTLATKTDLVLTPTPQVKKLFQVIYKEQKLTDKKDDDVPRIKVSDFISKMAFYYEKIRNSVDYNEEHLLRKNAIERILRRQIVIEGAISLKSLNSEEISHNLILELIRAGYLPNDKIRETKIDEIAVVISKYLKFREYSLAAVRHKNLKERNDLSHWILAVCASEIEERLGRSEVDLSVIEYMYEILLKYIELPADSKFRKDKEIQVFLAIHRNYLKFDKDMISFILFKYYHANWQDASDDEIKKIGSDINSLLEAINYQQNNPLSRQLNRLIARYTVFFKILRDVIEEDPVGVYELFKKDPKAFPRQIKQACQKRYKESKTKLWRAAFRSIIYIFITKSIFVFLLEVPATKYFGEELNPISLAINVSFPAVLLFLIVFFTKLPSDANTAKIVEGINGIVFEENKRKEPYKLRKPVKRGATMNSIFGFLYAVTFLVSFSAVIWALDKIGFNWVSIAIFLFFLAFVSFFSIRIRKNARELIIVPPKDNILSFFSDFFYVPIVLAGKWLSDNFSRINVFVFILDFIIEAPFKIFVEIAEEWTKYVKERKDEIV